MALIHCLITHEFRILLSDLRACSFQYRLALVVLSCFQKKLVMFQVMGLIIRRIQWLKQFYGLCHIICEEYSSMMLRRTISESLQSFSYLKGLYYFQSFDCFMLISVISLGFLFNSALVSVWLVTRFSYYISNSLWRSLDMINVYYVVYVYFIHSTYCCACLMCDDSLTG